MRKKYLFSQYRNKKMMEKKIADERVNEVNDTAEEKTKKKKVLRYAGASAKTKGSLRVRRDVIALALSGGALVTATGVALHSNKANNEGMVSNDVPVGTGTQIEVSTEIDNTVASINNEDGTTTLVYADGSSKIVFVSDEGEIKEVVVEYNADETPDEVIEQVKDVITTTENVADNGGNSEQAEVSAEDMITGNPADNDKTTQTTISHITTEKPTTTQVTTEKPNSNDKTTQATTEKPTTTQTTTEKPNSNDKTTQATTEKPTTTQTTTEKPTTTEVTTEAQVTYNHIFLKQTHNETQQVWVVDVAEWKESVPDYDITYGNHSDCAVCQQGWTGSDQCDKGAEHGHGYHTVTKYKTITHPEEGHYEAQEVTVTDGYKCSKCGKMISVEERFTSSDILKGCPNAY